MGTIFLLGIAGCATTQRAGTGDQLQSRVTEMEKKLEEKDSEIVDLQYEIKDLAGKLESASKSSTDTSEAPAAVPTVKGAEDVIRVNATVVQVQTALKNAGFYTGKVDGRLGSGTKAAIVAFQKSKGLRADGVVGRKTWEMLKQNLE